MAPGAHTPHCRELGSFDHFSQMEMISSPTLIERVVDVYTRESVGIELG